LPAQPQVGADQPPRHAGLKGKKNQQIVESKSIVEAPAGPNKSLQTKFARNRIELMTVLMRSLSFV